MGQESSYPCRIVFTIHLQPPIMQILSYDYLDRIKDLRGKEEAYTTYLQTQFYQKRLKEVLTESGQPLIETIVKGNVETYKMLDRVEGRLGEINNNLIDGFEEISYVLEESNIKLDQLLEETMRVAGILDWGFNAVIEQQRVSNLLLQDIGVVLRIPDFEKERIHYIEKGLQHLKKALYDADYYQHAESSFQEALKRDRTDHFTLLRIGLIHLFSPKGVNFALSIQYLEESLKSIRPEVLGNPHDSVLQKQFAVIAYYLGSVNMLIENYKKGEELLLEAVKANPSFGNARFQLCKAKYKLNDGTYLQDLEQLIHHNPLYFSKAWYDPDFSSTHGTVDLLSKLLHQKADPLVDTIKEIDAVVIEQSKFAEDVHSVKRLVRRSYAAVLKAEQLLKDIKTTEFYESKNEKPDDLKIGRIETIPVQFSGTLLDLLKKEKEYHERYEERVFYFESHIDAYRHQEESRRIKEAKEYSQKQRINLIAQWIIIVVSTVVFFLLSNIIRFDDPESRTISSGNPRSYGFTFITIVWAVFGTFFGFCIVKSVYNPASLKSLAPDWGKVVSSAFALVNGVFFASQNWEKNAGFFDWIGNAFAFIITILISLGIGWLVGKALGAMLEKD